MTYKTRNLRSVFAALGLLLAVSGCGNHPTQPFFANIGAFTSGLISSPEQAVTPQSRLTAARVGALKKPFILVSIPNRDAFATMTVFASNATVDDWRSADNSSLVLRGDIIVATRGLGADLFISEVNGVQEAVIAGNGRANRVYRYLDGEHREIVERFTCSYTTEGNENVDLIARIADTYRVRETCTPTSNESAQFHNVYWVGFADRKVLQSRQRINNQIGYVIIQHLKR